MDNKRSSYWDPLAEFDMHCTIYIFKYIVILLEKFSTLQICYLHENRCFTDCGSLFSLNLFQMIVCEICGNEGCCEDLIVCIECQSFCLSSVGYTIFSRFLQNVIVTRQLLGVEI